MKRVTKIDQVSTWYATEGFYAQLVLLGYETLKPYLHGTSLLEIGPADGAMTELLVNDFTDVTLLEPSSKYVNQLSKKFPNIEVIKNTAEHFDTEKKFDTIILAHVLEHMSNPVKSLEHIKKLMHARSRFIIIVPNADSLHRYVGVGIGLIKKRTQRTAYDLKLGHKRVYTMDLLRKHIVQANLSIRATGGILLKPLSNDQLKDWDPTLIRGLYNAGKSLPHLCAELFVVCGTK